MNESQINKYHLFQKLAGSIPAGVSGFFIDILPIALWPWVRLSL